MAKVRRTAKQQAASRRNLEKARKARRRTTSADMKALDSEVNLNAAVRNRGKRLSVSKQGPWSLYPRSMEQRRQKALKELKLGNGSKTGVMTPPQHNPTGGSVGKIYSATNASGQTIRKRNRMDAQAVQQGYYQW